MMTNTAAHLVDRVLPNVPLRQWVLSLPFDLRVLAARHPSLIAAIDRTLFREVERWMRRAAGPSKARAGAVTFVQRFGGSLNLHVHFHVLFLEGLFTREPESLPVFHPAVSPTRADLLEVVTRVRAGVLRELTRRGHEASTGPDDGEPDALEACVAAATQPGLFERLAPDPKASTPFAAEDEPTGAGRQSVNLDGFNLHAAVRVGPDDDVARERLARYCARPAFALERLELLPDGRLAYRIKQPRKHGTHRILTPLELLARIAALIPPPRHPFLRYHGVLAPNSRWRSAIVPRAPDESLRHPTSHLPPAADPPAVGAAHADLPASPAVHRPPTSHSTQARPTATARAPSRAAAPRPPPPASALGGSPQVDLARARSADRPPTPAPRMRAGFAVLSDRHRARLADGALLAKAPRLPWSTLLRRTYAADVLACPRCRGRARVIAAIQDPAEAARFLEAIDQVSEPRRSHLLVAEDDDSQLPPPSSRRPNLPVPDD